MGALPPGQEKEAGQGSSSWAPESAYEPGAAGTHDLIDVWPGVDEYDPSGHGLHEAAGWGE